MVESEFARANRKLEMGENDPLSETITAKDLCGRKIPPVRWVVDNYVPEKGIVLCGSKPKCYKTWFAMYTGLCVATGRSMFDVIGTTKKNVLFIDEEGNEQMLKTRCETLCDLLGIKDIENMHFLIRKGFRLDVVDWITRLEMIIERHDISLVIVDTLRRAFSGDENDSGEVNRLFCDTLGELTERLGVSFMLNHHLKKGDSQHKPDTIRGSTDIQAMVDGMIMLEHGKKGVFVIRDGGSRMVEQRDPVSIVFSEDTGEGTEIVMRWAGASEIFITALEQCKTDIIQFFKDRKLFVAKREVIRKGILSYNKSTFKRAIEEMALDGELKKDKKGVYIYPQGIIKNGSNRMNHPLTKNGSFSENRQ